MNHKTFPSKLLSATLLFAISMGIAPSAIASETQPQMTKQAQRQIAQSEPDIVGIASSNENFETLVTAVQAADLVETLQGEGPFTVFAPTDEAFAMLPDDIVEFLLQPENKDLLVDVLTYHVVSGNVTSNQLSTGSVESLGGGLSVAVSQNGVIINNATVIQADVEASNGVIHAVNRVLLPEGFTEKLSNRIN